MARTEKEVTVLVVEDDPVVASRLVRGLRKAGFTVELAVDGDTGFERALDPCVGLVVLDLMLPGCSGFEVLERLRERARKPVMVLSAIDALPDRLKIFELGAVDFVAKPFWMEELVARLRARLHIEEERPRRTVAWADVELDLDARVVRRGGEDLGLTRTEIDVLAFLVARRGRAVPRDSVAERVLTDGINDLRSVDGHVARIRKKLGAAAAAIHTVRGVGYRFEPGAS